MTETNRPRVIDFSVTIDAFSKKTVSESDNYFYFFYIDAKDITIDTSLLSMVDVNC